MSGIIKIVACLLVVWPVVAQSQTFAKITIHADPSAQQSNMRVQILPNGDLIANRVPVVMLLGYAYGVPTNPSPLLSSLPDWAVRERYDIEAKAGTQAIPPGLQDESQSRIQHMIRRLLADRFGFVMRVQKETMPVYALTVAAGGPNLQKSPVTERECIFDTAPQGCHNFIAGFGHPLDARAIDMDDLAHYLENWTDLPVVNRTHLSGTFTVNTGGWLPMRLPPPPPNVVPTANPFAGLPTLFSVLGKLGLELHQENAVLPVYTVEHIERPSAN